MRKLIIIPFLILCITLNAQNLYVAKTGNDATGNGTLLTPYLTITKAEDVADGGGYDTIFVRVGTYNELVRIYGNYVRSEESPFVIMAYNNEAVVIDGTGLTVGSGNALVRSSEQYTKFIGLEVEHSDQTGIMLDDDANMSQVVNCVVDSVQKSGITVIGDSCIIAGCTSSYASLQTVATPDSWSAGFSVGVAAGTDIIYNLIIRHCTITKSLGDGIAIRFCYNATVEDNIVYDNSNVGLYSRNSQYGLWQRNFVYQISLTGLSRVGIGHWNEGAYAFINENNSFINNIVYGCKRNLYAGSSSDGTTGLNIFANTFINSAAYYNVQLNSGNVTSSSFRNNVIVQEGTLPCMYFVEDVDFVFSNNLYNKAYDADAVGTNDQVSVAHIVGTAYGDTYSDTAFYQLVSASPGVNGGVAIIEVPNDYLDSLRAAPPDIGALEFYAPDDTVNPITLTTTIPTWTSATTATSGGYVIDDGGGTVSARGVCWNTTGTPTTADDKTTDGTGTGVYSSAMTGLTMGTSYYVRAYATNEVGTSYGVEYSMSTVIIMHLGKIITHLNKVMVID